MKRWRHLAVAFGIMPAQNSLSLITYIDTVIALVAHRLCNHVQILFCNLIN